MPRFGHCRLKDTGLVFGSGDRMNRYRQLAPWTKWLDILLIAGLAVAAVGIVLDLIRIATGDSFAIAPDFSGQDVFDLVAAVLLLVTFIVFGRWIYVASRNLHAADVPGLMFSPASCVWWYVVPIASLFKPYQAMREIWNGSKGATADELKAGATLLTIWWTLWIISNIAGNIGFRIPATADVATIAGFDLLSRGIDLALYWFARKLVLEIGEAQQRNPQGLQEIFA